MSGLRIFVSYSSKDQAFTDDLVYVLREAGADVWYSEQHGGTGPLLNSFTQEIYDRPIFIVVVSKRMSDTYWVNLECTLAVNLGHNEPDRIILPIFLPPFKERDLNNVGDLKILRAYRYIDGDS